MRKILTVSFLLSIFGCQKNPEHEIDTFFERLSVLEMKRNTFNMNIQNTKTTRTAEGGPYVPKEARSCIGGICKVTPMSSYSPQFMYDPKHSDANSKGYVEYPNINIQKERGKLIVVQRAINFLMDSMPVSKSYFYSDAIQKYLKKYPALNHGYNFKRILSY